ncbi:MAG: hypothetical protein Q8922_05700 [Bacteroidota bacterium]|nr:hypothetical protein [Bacteroidota bacterium]MDP4233102.1 hypothetical protein [Bacteroidota bacterium]MDP4241753.1 hypothetical protein [Bacteroidota bacterium]MDP4287411.1 hypothetical protein [Bacteroidota bacterium]
MRGVDRNWRPILWLAALGFLSRIALAFRSEWQIASRPYLDDAYYLFSCARHLALGHGFTVDGIHPTNGIQALICLLYAPGFWISSDPSVGLRLTFLVGALVQAASTIVLALLLKRMQKYTGETSSFMFTMFGRRISTPIIGALLWTIIAPLADQNGSGLETGLVALILLTTLLYFQVVLELGWNISRSCLIGAALGLMVLARVDSALFVLGFALVELWRTRMRAFGFVAIAVVVAGTISLPWWIYSFTRFGSFMPISGAAESIGRPIGENLLQTSTALFDMLTIFFNHVYFAWPPWFEVASFLSLCCAWMLLLQRLDAVKYLKAQFDLRVLAPLVVFSVLLLIFYNFFFSAPHFLVRYLHSFRVLILILAAALTPLLARAVREWSSRIGKFAVVVFILMAAYFSIYRYVNEYIAPPKSDFYRVGLWARQHTGQVGMDQSGTAGFYAPNVINLDGKVNRDALAAIEAGGIGQYIAREKIEYLADWKPLVERLVMDAKKYGADYSLFDSIGYIRIYKYDPR